jgi:hypothetical protein
MRLPDVPIYDELPEGWADISHIVSAPSGYHWINNRKSIFSDEYRHALLRIRNYDNNQVQMPEVHSE